jgi:hypothetical protein
VRKRHGAGFSPSREGHERGRGARKEIEVGSRIESE